MLKALNILNATYEDDIGGVSVQGPDLAVLQPTHDDGVVTHEVVHIVGQLHIRSSDMRETLAPPSIYRVSSETVYTSSLFVNCASHASLTIKRISYFFSCKKIDAKNGITLKN